MISTWNFVTLHQLYHGFPWSHSTFRRFGVFQTLNKKNAHNCGFPRLNLGTGPSQKQPGNFPHLTDGTSENLLFFSALTWSHDLKKHQISENLGILEIIICHILNILNICDQSYRLPFRSLPPFLLPSKVTLRWCFWMKQPALWTPKVSRTVWMFG